MSDTPMTEASNESLWQIFLGVLIPKACSPSVSDYRPIAILYIMHKLYMEILYFLLVGFVKISGPQYGPRPGWQCIEVVMLIRQAIEKGRIWGLPVLIVSLDILKAFDTLSLRAVIYIFEKLKVNTRLEYAILKEYLQPQKMRFSYHRKSTELFDGDSGLRQGSPEASFIFSLIVADILSDLDAKWQTEGKGLFYRAFGGHEYAWNDWWTEHKHLFSASFFPSVYLRAVVFF